MTSLLARVRSFWRGLRRPVQLEAEMDEEMRFHIEMEAQRLTRERGLAPDEALRQAAIAFGGVEKRKEEGRDIRGIGWVSGLSLDLKLGARMLMKHPGLAIAGGLGLTIATVIGTSFFFFFNTYVFPTIPLDEGDRIVGFDTWDVERSQWVGNSLHDFAVWREELQSVEDVGAFRTVVRNLFIPGAAAGRVEVAEITPSGFRAGRVAPLLGRPLLDQDEQRGAEAVVVIGFEEWQARFAGDPEVIGRQIRFGDTPHTIVGVMPPGFAFPTNHRYWTPLRAHSSAYDRGERSRVFAFGRLREGVAIESAQAELTAVGQRLAADFPETHEGLRPTLMPYVHPLLDMQGATTATAGAIQLVVSLLLVVVALNVAILVYARTATRVGEIAVRTALGASRRRIVTQLFLEALVLASLASAVGLTIFRVASGRVATLMQDGADEPFWVDYGITPATVLYVIGLTFLAAFIVGALPGLQATGRRLQSNLRALGGGTGIRMGRTWTLLIVAQVAVAVAVLPTVVALAWSQVRNGVTQATFPADEFLSVGLVLEETPPPGVAAEDHRRELERRYRAVQTDLLRRLEQEPGVADVAFGSYAPGLEPTTRIEVEGASESRRYSVGAARVDLDYFEVLDLPLHAGRLFQPGDIDAGAVIVNNAFVQQIVGGGDPLGRRVHNVAESNQMGMEPSEPFEIVGVVEDLHTNPIDPESTRPMLYHAMGPPAGPVSVAARVRGTTPTEIAGRAREIASAVEPAAWVTVTPIAALYREQESTFRFVAIALGAAILSVLLLSAGGIYVLMSFAVTRRQREIGIRTALGAHPQQIVRAVFSRSIRQLALGIAAGALAAFAVDRLAGGGLLGGNEAVLLPIFAAVMLTVGALAALGPARRGLRIQPMEALREE